MRDKPAPKPLDAPSVGAGSRTSYTWTPYLVLQTDLPGIGRETFVVKKPDFGELLWWCVWPEQKVVLTEQLAPSFALLPSFGKLFLLGEVGTIHRNSSPQATQPRMPSTLLQKSGASRDNLAMPIPPGQHTCKSSRKANPWQSKPASSTALLLPPRTAHTANCV